MAVF